MAKLFETVAPEIIVKCIETAQSADELMMAAYILLNSEILQTISNISSEVQKQRIVQAVEYLIKHYIREKFDPEKIHVLRCSLRTVCDCYTNSRSKSKKI
jgi:isopropylmalate/homocitrate/citramalate synthase